MSIFKTYRRNIPLSLRAALDDCVAKDAEKAKSFIYKKYYGYVMAVVVRYIKMDMEAEEVVNESFVKIFRKLASFEQHEDDEVLEKTFKSWIARVAVNTSIDLLRGKKNMQFVDDEDDVELSRLSVDISTSLEANDIIKLLDALPTIQKAIFNMYEIEGYSHEEISRELGVPESTSRTYLTRAKQKLRLLYAKYIENEKIHS